MTKNKKIFLLLGGIFLIIVIIIGIDISSRTTFPGSKGNLKERIAPADTIKNYEQENKN